MTTGRPTVAVAATAAVGEGPAFDPRTGRLCWVDIGGMTVIESDLATGDRVVHEPGTMVGAVVPRRRHGGFAVAAQDGFGLLENGRLTLIDDVISDPTLRMNDGKCDPAGRLWAGSTDMAFAPGRGRLHSWDGLEPSRVMADGFTLPNGLGWDLDATTMFFIDTMAGALMRAPFDLERGDVGAFETFATVDAGLPDGLAVDTDGNVWVAIWGGSAVHKYDPRGSLVDTVTMPVSQPSSCAFDERGNLYVTSARTGLSTDALVDEPLAGSVFVIPTDARGVPVASFAN